MHESAYWLSRLDPDRSRSGKRRDTMTGPFNRNSQPSGATRRMAVGLFLGAPLLAACSNVQQSLGQFGSPQPDAGPAGPQQQPLAVGNGQVKVGLILPLSAAGN